MKLEVGKKYRLRNGDTAHVISAESNGTYLCDSEKGNFLLYENGNYWKSGNIYYLDAVGEVTDNGSENIIKMMEAQIEKNLESMGFTNLDRGIPPKQSLLSLSLNLPQGTESITFTQKVLVDGVEYLANIELEKV